MRSHFFPLMPGCILQHTLPLEKQSGNWCPLAIIMSKK
ncbi:hypothetical protein HMPREF0889_1524 [Megasphaera lornae]|uniref:Uncharacterized protein n=1 Tax=Megasphaera lornae TaxID=1000568 RepID=D3LT01_9FIRM|nr:hypothetical protein HMPREF0889_1524 [Megasphaera genomosp. type_1 str. 28L]